MYCFFCRGENVDWEKLSCPDCGANEENDWNPKKGERLGDKKIYISKRTLGYALLDMVQPKIDPDAEYFIDCYSPAAGNRPVIVRCDGKEYCGHSRWIVDEIDLIAISQNS
ncbi:hypothetical protein [Aneurinibacillus thermoaerophilus]|uniref:hypothetical protein n=1 Tax=Aneurinibacillus thermoaerophilus TaxID=143495 RepID=UPI002E23F1A5|nr:hypothetical protein [Aneurinibacillus thermoaerophilus]